MDCGRRLAVVSSQTVPTSNSLHNLHDKHPGLKIVLLNAKSVNGKAASILDESANLAQSVKIWLAGIGGGGLNSLRSVFLDSQFHNKKYLGL